MSFVQPRPASPPPRSFSPAIVLAPLPPPVRRRTPSAPRPAHLSLEATRARTKSDRSLRLDKTLASARSCGELRTPATPRSARSVVSAPPTPRSIAPSSPSDSSFRRTHKRNLSFAVPYRSPPASPTIASPPPPVPRIPEFVLSPTDKKPVLHTPAPPPTRVEHIYLPDWEQFAVVPDFAREAAAHIHVRAPLGRPVHPDDLLQLLRSPQHERTTESGRGPLNARHAPCHGLYFFGFPAQRGPSQSSNSKSRPVSGALRLGEE